MRYSLATFTLESNNGQQYPEISSNHKQNAKECKNRKQNHGIPSSRKVTPNQSAGLSPLMDNTTRAAARTLDVFPPK